MAVTGIITAVYQKAENNTFFPKRLEADSLECDFYKNQLPARFAIGSHCLLSICYIYLFSRFGFKSGNRLLIAPVPVHCFSIT